MEELREQLRLQVSELLPALDGPGGAVCGYLEAHSYLVSLRDQAEQEEEAARKAEAQLPATIEAEGVAAGAAAAAAQARVEAEAEARAAQGLAAQAAQECTHWTQQHLQVGGPRGAPLGG